MDWLFTMSRSGGVMAKAGVLTCGFLSTLSLWADTLMAHVMHRAAASDEIASFLIILSSVLLTLEGARFVCTNANGGTRDSAGFHMYHLVMGGSTIKTVDATVYLRCIMFGPEHVFRSPARNANQERKEILDNRLFWPTDTDTGSRPGEQYYLAFSKQYGRCPRLEI
jgi:hypothetical protein